MFHLALLFLCLPPVQRDRSIVWTAGWSHDDKYVATGNDKGWVNIYETANWRKVYSWCDTGATIAKLEWNPKYPLLAITGFTSGNHTPTTRIFNMETRQSITLPDTIKGRGVSWKPDGEQVAFVSTHGYISIFFRNGVYIKTLSYRNPNGLFDIDWHPSLNLLLAVEENIHLIDIDRNIVQANFEDGTENKGILCAQWHPSGQYFATGDYGHEGEGGEPSFLKIWSLTGTLKSASTNSKSEYRNIRWSNDGKYLAAAGDMLLLFDHKNKLKKIKTGRDNCWGIGWNSTSNKIVTTDQAGVVRIVDVKGKLLRKFK